MNDKDPPREAIVLDIAENCHISSMSSYMMITGVTLRLSPCAVVYIVNEMKIFGHRALIGVICDCLEHVPVAVLASTSVMLSRVKTAQPFLNHVMYFSDQNKFVLRCSRPNRQPIV